VRADQENETYDDAQHATEWGRLGRVEARPSLGHEGPFANLADSHYVEAAEPVRSTMAAPATSVVVPELKASRSYHRI